MQTTRLKNLREMNKNNFLESIDGILKNENNCDISALKIILNDHWRWHAGEFNNINELFNINSTDEFIIALSTMYKAFSFNTYGKLSESNSILDDLFECETNIKEKVNIYTGSSFNCSLHSWKIWNCVELQDYRSIFKSLKFANDLLLESSTTIKNTSAAQLFLAVGVMFTHHRNYQVAFDFLNAAINILNENSIWRPRVYSALSLLEFFKDKKKSLHYLDAAIDGKEKHFGPMGWQLRIAESMFLHGRKNDAIGLLSEIYAGTIRKKENIYSLWAFIFDLYFRGEKLDSNDFMDILKNKHFAQMNRAINFITLNNMIEYK